MSQAADNPSLKEVVSFDPQICRQCRGLCCQGHPGAWLQPRRLLESFFPQGFPPASLLAQQLQQLQLELRDYDGVAIIAPMRSETGCSFLTSTGCALSIVQRPCQCLALEPALETLLSGEIECQLPGSHSYGNVRSSWQNFWLQLERLKITAGNAVAED